MQPGFLQPRVDLLGHRSAGLARRWAIAELTNKRFNGQKSRSRPPLLQAFNINDVQSLYGGLHNLTADVSGLSVYNVKCRDLGIPTSSKVMEELPKVRGWNVGVEGLGWKGLAAVGVMACATSTSLH